MAARSMRRTAPPGKEHEEYKAYYRFVPKTFVLEKDTTNYDLLAAKGFWIEVVKTTEPLDSIGDLTEGTREFYKGSPGSYGGFKDVVRDGRPAYAFEGGDRVNPYESVISWNFRDDAYISVISEYLTLDETLPIFESIMT